MHKIVTDIKAFLSTLSLRRATVQIVIVIMYALFLSTLSLRRATHKYHNPGRVPKNFYPRSPCGERPAIFDFFLQSNIIFLSTLSLRRATSFIIYSITGKYISIHALLAESDPRSCRASSPRPYFYPRSPCGERRSEGTRAT